MDRFWNRFVPLPGTVIHFSARCKINLIFIIPGRSFYYVVEDFNFNEFHGYGNFGTFLRYPLYLL